MAFRVSRRKFVSGLGLMTAATVIPSIPSPAFLDPHFYPPADLRGHGVKSPFRVAVINDEITQDFGRACEVAAREFGMDWIELRGMWNKNLLKLDSKEVDEARRILEKNNLRVTDIASPLFKVDWPGAPKTKYSPNRDKHNA